LSPGEKTWEGGGILIQQFREFESLVLEKKVAVAFAGKKNFSEFRKKDSPRRRGGLKDSKRRGMGKKEGRCGTSLKPRSFSLYAWERNLQEKEGTWRNGRKKKGNYGASRGRTERGADTSRKGSRRKGGKTSRESPVKGRRKKKKRIPLPERGKKRTTGEDGSSTAREGEGSGGGGKRKIYHPSSSEKGYHW